MLTRKMPWELGPEEIEYFYKAVDTDAHSGSVDDVSEDILGERLSLWVWEEDHQSDYRNKNMERPLLVVITEVAEYRDGYKEFCVKMLAGNGGIENQPEIVESLCKEASASGCKKMIAYMKPYLFEKFGIEDVIPHFPTAEKVYIVIGMEV